MTGQQQKKWWQKIWERIRAKKSIYRIEKELDEKLITALRGKLGEEEFNRYFADIVEAGLEIAQRKSEKNKKAHFRFEWWIIIISALNTLISAIIAIGGEKSVAILTNFVNKQLAEQIYFITRFLGVLAPIVVTTLLAIQKLKKHEETWLRHSKRYSDIRCETINYISNVNQYGENQEAESLDNKACTYKSKIMSILCGNHKVFENNIKKGK